MHILCILVDNNFLLLHTHTGDLTLNSNVTCDLLSNDRIPCIRITQDGITLDCNGYSIIGPGAGLTIGIFVQFANNTIIKNCNVESFFEGIDVIIDGSLTVESTTVSNNGAGIGADLGGSLTLKNVLAENNRVGLSTADNGGTKLIIDNAYFCNNSEKDINIEDPFGDGTCPEVEANGQIFASTFESDCPIPIKDAINESLEENGFGPIKSCTDLVAQQALLSDM